MPDVHLVDKVIKAGPEVKVGVPENERKLRGDWLDLASAHAILKSISVTLQNAGPSLSIQPPEETTFDSSVVGSRSLQFRDWLV